jgi:hypothetical protein
MGTTCRAIDEESGVRLDAHVFNDIKRTSSSLAVSVNSNFRLVALVKTRDESKWRRSLRPVNVAAILRIVVEILIYRYLLTLYHKTF